MKTTTTRRSKRAIRNQNATAPEPTGANSSQLGAVTISGRFSRLGLVRFAQIAFRNA